MQTFEVLQTAASNASSLNNETGFCPKKPSLGSEKFGDVMDRALNASPGESKPDDTDNPVSENSGKKGATAPSGAAPTKQATNTKKPVQSQPPKGEVIVTESATVIACASQAAQTIKPQINPQVIAHDGDPSDTEPGSGDTKGKHNATGKGKDTAKSASAQILTLVGVPIAVPLPPPTPAPATPVTAKSPKGSSSPTPTALPKLAGGSNTIELPTASEILHPTEKSAPGKAEPQGTEAKTSAELPKNAAPANGVTAQDSPASPAESHSAKAIPLDSLKASSADTSHVQLPKSKGPAVAPTPPSTEPDGISAAKQYTTMKKAEKTPKVAGQNEQDLPGKPTSGSAELSSAQKLPAAELAHSAVKVESAPSLEAPAAAKISTNPEPAAAAISSVAVPPANAADGRLRVLERTHDIVALHAMRLAQTGSDTLHVVVKPGDGVQLSLELRQNAGTVQVSASLHKGDFEHLSQHWPELQQRLESRGVRVSTLTTSDNFSSTSHQNSQQQKQQSSQHDPLYAGAFAEFALAGSMSGGPAARAARPTVHRGWETWA